MVSLWEKESLLSYDVIVIGAGVTGMSTAASLKERSPGMSILVIERGTLPTGASTRNAGFACFGSTSELLEDIKHLGEDGMCQLVEKRWLGLQKTKTRLGISSIGFESSGGYELIRDSDHWDHDIIPRLNQLLKNVIGNQVFEERSREIKQLGFRNIRHMVFNPYEGALHSGKLMASLWDYCQSLGVRFITGTPVTSIDSGTGSIHTKGFTFRSKCIAVCTNAFSGTLINNLDLKPGRGLVLLVQPKKPITYKGTFHYDQGYYYFRDFGQKLLFGGGRNLDLESETTLEFGINPDIKEKLLQDLNQIILPDQDYKVEMEWSGIMAFGETKAPVVQQVDDNLYVGVRLGGMGVALGSMVGEDLADLIQKAQF